ncbi:MAG: SDR family NAD(P)-dependent oxidoreductase [Proteobacteria bacterium]|nr:SDR family NAD(P)-dependent oxidoreductase [Pseudomonadota bacterium]
MERRRHVRLRNERVLMTGGAGGIGSLIAESLIKGGANLTVIDRAAALPYDARLIRGDLSTLEGLETVAATTAAEPWDILINLAGVQHFGPFGAQSGDALVTTYMVNLIAPARLVQAVLPCMRERRHGRIVNIGSIFGSINFAHFVSYSSSKSGLHALSQGLRRELAGSGVRVIYVAPRAVNTPLNSPLVREFAKQTKMTMDEPKRVARRIVKAIVRCEREAYLGFPESLFVRVNALAPSLVDGALAANDQRAAKLFVA